MNKNNSASSSLALLAVRSALHHDVRAVHSREFRPLRCGQLARSGTWTGLDLCLCSLFTVHGPRFLHELVV